MIPDHVVALIVVLVVAWFLFRFGTLLFLLTAFVCFWNGAFLEAACAFVSACAIEAIKTAVTFWLRVVEGYRGPWI